MNSFEHIISSLVTMAVTSNHRRLVVLSGEQAWAFSQLESVITPDDCLWLGDGEQDDCVPMNKASGALGREYRQLVFNAYSGFNPDSFGQSVGTVSGGGLCFVIAPPLADWAEHFNDPDHQRYLASPEQQGLAKPFFLLRLIDLIRQDADAVIIEQHQPLPILPADDNLIPATLPSGEEQAGVIEQIIKTVTGHRKRPLVITADRGRGKSSALGFAAAQLLQAKLDHITVTAPNIGALESLFKHAAQVLSGSELVNGVLSWQGKTIAFVPPDELVQSLPNCEFLMIDEAAAIPTPMLTRLAQHYSRLVFSTTVHGYEGTGRGFALRFIKTLASISPQWRRAELNQPMRWGSNDPLERVCDQILGLRSKFMNLDSPLSDEFTFERLSQQQLFENEELLQQIFSLLVIAHYQTKPSDFRQLLDAPNLNVFVIRQDNQVVATALVLDEGRIEAQLAQQIVMGKRRLRGHLLPQSLMSQMGINDAGSYRYARVMRIAVHPQLQRHGCGAKLERHLVRWASEQKFDYIGASFGATDELTQFWLNSAYRPIRVGLTKDKASGTHSLLVLKALSAQQHVLSQAQHIFSQALSYSLNGDLTSLDAELVITLMGGVELPVVLDGLDERNIANFIVSDRPFEQVDYAVSKLIWSAPGALKTLSLPQQQIIVSKVLQQQTWQQVVGRVDANGKKQIKSELKQSVKQLYSMYLSHE